MRSWHYTLETLENSNLKAQCIEIQGQYCSDILRFWFHKSLKFTLPCCFTGVTSTKLSSYPYQIIADTSWLHPTLPAPPENQTLSQILKKKNCCCTTWELVDWITLPIGWNSFWSPSAYLCLSNDKTQFHRWKNGKGHIFLFFPCFPFLSTDKLGLYFSDKLRNIFCIFRQKMAVLQRDKQLPGKKNRAPLPMVGSQNLGNLCYGQQLWTSQGPGQNWETCETTKEGFIVANRIIIWPWLFSLMSGFKYNSNNLDFLSWKHFLFLPCNMLKRIWISMLRYFKHSNKMNLYCI